MFNIIAVRTGSGRTNHLKIGSFHLWVLLSIGVVVLALAVFLGFKIGASSSGSSIIDKKTIRSWQADLNSQNTVLQSLRELSDTRAEALTTKMGQMQAEIYSLQDLSQRLARIAKVDLDSFDLSGKKLRVYRGDKPALSADLASQINELSEQLTQRSSQLAVLESLLVHSDLDYELYMQGRPVETGYISSYYGQRADPFHGQTAFHRGIDFAGEEGAKFSRWQQVL